MNSKRTNQTVQSNKGLMSCNFSHKMFEYSNWLTNFNDSLENCQCDAVENDRDRTILPTIHFV